jgi:hypothetical protein
MVLGNCMTGIALGLNTLTTSLMLRRASVEAQLMLGATRWDAAAPVTRDALRCALMPTINSMSATGLASLPGTMTGQILSGVPPRRGGQIPDPSHVPDCGRYWFRGGGRGTRRRLPPNRSAAPASPRSFGAAAGYLDEARHHGTLGLALYARRPRPPKAPPAARSQSGLRRVVSMATTAAPVTETAVQVIPAAWAITIPLAMIRRWSQE